MPSIEKLKFGELHLVRKFDDKYYAGFSSDGKLITAYDSSFTVYIFNKNQDFVGIISIYDDGYIANLSVEEKYQHCGYGTMLLEIAVQIFGGKRLICLKNNESTKLLCENLGFKITKENQNYYNFELKKEEFKPFFGFTLNVRSRIIDTTLDNQYIADVINKKKEELL